MRFREERGKNIYFGFILHETSLHDWIVRVNKLHAVSVCAILH